MHISRNQVQVTCLTVVWLAISAAAQTIEPICSLTNNSFSSTRNPRGGSLNLARDGNFYGTTQYGGSGGFGTIFKVTTSGALSVLASFDAATTGGNPYGGVTLGSDGNLYGATQFSGAHGSGTIFRVTTNGVLTILYAFSSVASNGSSSTNADGSSPYAAVALGPDGYLYGTTSQGGANGSGTVFKITTNGVLTTLFSFDPIGINATNITGASPYGGLTWGPDGNLYGTTFLGGSVAKGTIFKVTTNGAFTLLVDLVGPNGSEPQVTITLGPGGSLYGTTLNGGIYGDEGTVFRLTTNGVLTTLVSFNYNTGAAPQAPVTFGPDGNLYGTTSTGSSDGSGSWGTVFRVGTNGVLTTLANFANTNGFSPQAGVAFGPDRNLYGSTYFGGSSDPNAAGVIYRLNVGLAVTNQPPDISRRADGAVILNLPGTTGTSSRLWATTNLTLPLAQWQALATNVLTMGFFQFTDTNTTAIPAKFYRLSTP